MVVQRAYQAPDNKQVFRPRVACWRRRRFAQEDRLPQPLPLTQGLHGHQQSAGPLADPRESSRARRRRVGQHRDAVRTGGSARTLRDSCPYQR